MEIQYFISPHEHPLRLKDGTDEEDKDGRLLCHTCGVSAGGDGPFYGCNSCGFRLHKRCSASPPHQIIHPFHPADHGPLSLVSGVSGWCDSCFKAAQSIYRCGSFACFFAMDVQCALMPTGVPSSSRPGQQWIQHWSHPHPLSLLEKDDQFKCAACTATLQCGRAYGCLSCDYFLEKFCADLPLQIHCPLHSAHGLLTGFVRHWLFKCKICDAYTDSRGIFSFECSRPDFIMCGKCAKDVLMNPRNYVKYEYHEHPHPLSLLKNTNVTELNSQCHGYDDYCTQPEVSASEDFKSTNSFMLWCWNCEFRVHLLCGPLPSVIKHECHIHPLVLADSLRDDDPGECYCDVCETERDPWIRLYCCHECKYFAHVKCVISEIEKVLGEEHINVKLKTPSQDFWEPEGHELKIDDAEHGKSALTLRDVINELSEENKAVLRSWYKWDETSSTSNKNKEIQNASTTQFSKLLGDEDIDEVLRFSSFTEKSFESIISTFYQYFFENELELKSSDLELKVVKVQGYMIPHSLAVVLNRLLNEFGDIGSGSSETIGMKSFVYFTVCKVLKGMHCTMAKGITKAHLQEWFFHLKFARRRCFKIDFACAKLEKLSRAFLVYQAKRLEDEIPAVLKRISELQKRLDKRKQASKSEFEKESLNIASELEGKDALGDLSQHENVNKLTLKYWRWSDMSSPQA